VSVAGEGLSREQKTKALISVGDVLDHLIDHLRDAGDERFAFQANSFIVEYPSSCVLVGDNYHQGVRGQVVAERPQSIHEVGKRQRNGGKGKHRNKNVQGFDLFGHSYLRFYNTSCQLVTENPISLEQVIFYRMRGKGQEELSVAPGGALRNVRRNFNRTAYAVG